MTDKIKLILLNFAEDIISNQDSISSDTLHEKVQKLYEISLIYNFLSKSMENTSHWKDQELQLDKLLDELALKDVTPKTTSSPSANDNLEVPPLMETIKNLVTEIPENEQTKTVYDHSYDLPKFVKRTPSLSQNDDVIVKDKKNLNDRFNQGLMIDLNDRLAFIKNLFDNSQSEYQRVISQVVTFSNYKEAQVFISEIIKPEYNQWTGKEIFEDRFLKILENYFSSTS